MSKINFSIDFVVEDMVMCFTIKKGELRKVDVTFDVRCVDDRSLIDTGTLKLYVENETITKIETEGPGFAKQYTRKIVEKAADIILARLPDLIKENCYNFAIDLALQDDEKR